jgi:hypothetical protein
MHRGSANTAQFVEALYDHLDGDILFQRWNAVSSTLAGG